MPWPKQPGGYSGTTSTFVDAGRNLNGRVVGSVIRNDVAKVEFQYGPISFDMISKILSQFNDKQGGAYFRRIEFFNIVTNRWDTREFYVSGDRTTDIFRLSGTGRPDMCQSFRIAFIER